MKRIKKMFKDLWKKYLISFKRFPVSNSIVILLGIFLIITIVTEFAENVYISLSLSLIFSLFLSLYISLFKDNVIFNSVISLTTTIVLYLIIHSDIDNLYFILAYTGLLIICVLLIIDKLSKYVKENIIAYLVSKLVYCGIISSIIMVGLMICASCFVLLIYSFDDIEKFYLIIVVLCEVVLNISLFIIFIPRKGEKIKISKLYSLLLNKVSLTLYYLLIVLLYVYLFKILITLTLPVGVINWFASFSLLFYIFFILSNDDKYILNVFNKKYGCYILIPIFIIQQISIFIRVDAYGLTTPRVLSLVFNLISLVFILLVVMKRKNYFYIISCVIIFVFTVLPYTNSIDLAAYNQEYRLKMILISNNMLSNNVIVPNDTISVEDKKSIISSYDYLKNSISNKISLVKKDTNFENTFGFNYDDYINIDNVRYCNYYNAIESLDISDYKSFSFIDQNYFVDKKDLKQYCMNIYNKYGSHNDNTNLEYKVNDNEIIYFSYLFFEIKDDGIIEESIQFDGYKLY